MPKLTNGGDLTKLNSRRVMNLESIKRRQSLTQKPKVQPTFKYNPSNLKTQTQRLTFIDQIVASKKVDLKKIIDEATKFYQKNSSQITILDNGKQWAYTVNTNSPMFAKYLIPVLQGTQINKVHLDKVSDYLWHFFEKNPSVYEKINEMMKSNNNQTSVITSSPLSNTPKILVKPTSTRIRSVSNSSIPVIKPPMARPRSMSNAKINMKETNINNKCDPCPDGLIPTKVLTTKKLPNGSIIKCPLCKKPKVIPQNNTNMNNIINSDPEQSIIVNETKNNKKLLLGNLKSIGFNKNEINNTILSNRKNNNNTNKIIYV